MTSAEKNELALIPLFAAGLWLAAPALPDTASIGNLLLAACVLFLLEGFFRDLWLLSKQKRSGRQDPLRQMRCMCVESTIGVTGVIAGVVVLGAGIDRIVAMDRWAWSLSAVGRRPSAVGIMAACFAPKDHVIEWNPLRIRRDKDHVNIAFTWRQ